MTVLRICQFFFGFLVGFFGVSFLARGGGGVMGTFVDLLTSDDNGLVFY